MTFAARAARWPRWHWPTYEIVVARPLAIATFATILAIPAGLIPAVLYMRADSAHIPGGSIISIPTSAIAALTLGVPLMLAVIGWLTAGRPRPLAALRP